MTMTLDAFKNRIIADGIRSVEKHETQPERIRGCLAGFELCRILNTPEDFEKMLDERQREERQLVSLKIPPEEYWEYRSATAQVEFVYERMKAAWHYNGVQEFPSLSARSVMQYAEIVGIKGEK